MLLPSDRQVGDNSDKRGVRLSSIKKDLPFSTNLSGIKNGVLFRTPLSCFVLFNIENLGYNRGEVFLKASRFCEKKGIIDYLSAQAAERREIPYLRPWRS